ncbi:BTAD domain-containing putative transcriptional regulator (plasmid) [Deinococcus radiomollis]|uniref:ATP-binding protein n=1 Tax=Deinococcus radiomollis TaxID=468916 RepID=UPI0038923586
MPQADGLHRRFFSTLHGADDYSYSFQERLWRSSPFLPGHKCLGFRGQLVTEHKVEATLLGKASLRQNGLGITLSTRKSLALLAYLALEGRTERARLASLLWTDLDHALALGNLRREVYRLHTTPLWSLLDISPDHIGFSDSVPTDIAAFRAHLNTHRLDEALMLYRGPFLDGLDMKGAADFDVWLSEQRADLEAAYHAALARHATALEAEGDLRGALSVQVILLRSDDLQERTHCETMRLHALLGERDLALQCFERLKSLLKRELGLDPLPETAELAARIRAASLPEAVLSPGGQTPLLAPPLVGRDEAWKELSRSSAAVCLIICAPGLGKTRLAEDFARSRASTVFIRGLEALDHTPLAPVADALRRALADTAARARLDGLEDIWRCEVAWLVPEIDPQATTAQPSFEARDRFLEGLARALHAAAGPGGTVVFDDFQWYEALTVEVALHLTRLSDGSDLRLVVTARAVELLDNLVATRALGSLERLHQVQRIELGPLGDLDVLTLVRALSGGTGAQLFSRRLHEATGGNPLYLLETLRGLFAAGLLQSGAQGWTTPFDEATSDYAELPIPSSVREAVLRRVDALGGGVRRLLELASLAGNGFRLDWLAGASALTEWEQLDALDRALAAHLILPLGNGHGFSHDLIRRALDDAIGPERRALSHRKLAINLVQAGGPPGQIADHFERGGQPEKATRYRVDAGQEAARMFAHLEALGHYAQALLDGAEGNVAADIHLARAELLAAASDSPAVELEVRRAAQLAERLGDPELEARVALADAGLRNTQGRYAEAFTLTERLLAHEALSATLRTSALYEQGTALLRMGRLDEAEPCLQAALGQAPAGALDLIGKLHTHLQGCAIQRGDLPLAQVHNAAALRTFRAAGSRLGTARALGGAGLLAGLQGDARAATGLLSEALVEARSIGDVNLQRTLLLNLFKFTLEAGDLEAAVPCLEEGLALAREPQDPYLQGVFLNNLGMVQRLRGDYGAALRAVHAALEVADRAGIVQHQVRRRLALAESHLDLGDQLGARPLLEEARRLAEPTGLNEVHAWIEHLHARCELAAGEPGEALARLQQLQASGEHIDADDQMRGVWLSSLAYLALGAPQDAFDLVCTLDLPPEPLLRGWLLSVRLTARSQLDLDNTADAASAEVLLASRQLYPLESLRLECALEDALMNARETGRSEAHRHARQAHVTRLADSLNDFQALRHCFLSRSRDLKPS